MKKNKIALLLALSLTLTQSVEMVVPVAASELNTEIAQEVVQEETDAEEEVTGSDTAENDVSETIASDECASEDAEENRTEVNRQDEETQNVESVVTENTQNGTDEVEVLEAGDEGETAESDIPDEDRSEDESAYNLIPNFEDSIGNGAMLPDSEMTIKTELIEKAQYTNVNDYKLEILSVAPGLDVTVADNGKDLLVKSGSETGSFRYYVSVQVLDENGVYKEAFKSIMETEVSAYLLMPQELKDAAGNPLNPFVGETVDIAGLGVKLYKYENGKTVQVDTVDGDPVKIVVARWEDEESGESGYDCDLNAWEPEIDQNQEITKLTRISEDTTYIALTAMCQASNGDWYQVARKMYDIDQVDQGDEEENPYDLNTDFEDTIGNGAMLPGHEMTIKTQLVKKTDWSPIEAYKLKVLFAPSAVTVTVKENGKDLLVKAGDKTGSFTCYVSVLMPDEKGEYKEAFKNSVIVEVSEYLLMPQELKDQSGKPVNPAVGESINLADLGVKLGKYSDGKIDLVDNVDGYPVKIVVGSWIDEETGKTEYDCDLDAWDLKLVEGQDLPILTRKQGYSVRIALTALCQDDNGGWYQIARKDYNIAEAEESHTHEWVLSKIVKEPTCTEAGSKIEKCASCEEERTVSIPAKGHTEVKDAAVAATCTAVGKTEGSHCSACGKVLNAQQTIPAKGHTVVKDAAVAPTVLKEGKTEGSHCSVCGTVIKKQNTVAKLTATVTLTAQDLKMKTGQTTTAFRATGFVAGDYVKAVTSSDPAVVKVTNVKSDGTFKLAAGKKKGNATVTVTLASGKTAAFKVTVQKEAVKTTKITTSTKSLTLAKGATYKNLAPSITVAPVTSKEKVTYTSSNKKVATVSSNGVIKAKKAGTAKITVKSGKKKVVVTVKVTGVKTTKLTGVPATKQIAKGKTFKIKATVAPKNTDDKVTYKSSDKKIATVTSKGVVKGKKKGTATITVQSGSEKVTCKVTVK